MAGYRLQGRSLHIALTREAEDVQVALAVWRLVWKLVVRLSLVLLISVPVGLEMVRLLLDRVDGYWYHPWSSLPCDHIDNLEIRLDWRF